tara:strand:- start:3058 stop:3528 length:471 start_codon:yes stop_codon:yes gene_type:complete
MNLSLNLNDIKSYNICFLEQKQNIIMDGSFTKINYLNEDITMNGTYIYFPINHTSFDIRDNKHYIKFNYTHETKLTEFITFESNILDYYNISHNNNKTKNLLLSKQIHSGYMKFYKNNINLNSKNNFFTLKISGIWENASNIGLTYKLLLTNNIIN